MKKALMYIFLFVSVFYGQNDQIEYEVGFGNAAPIRDNTWQNENQAEGGLSCFREIFGIKFEELLGERTELIDEYLIDYRVIINLINNVNERRNILASFANALMHEFLDQDGNSIPHMAIARVILHCENNMQYVYPIPYLFLSGESIGTAFDNRIARSEEINHWIDNNIQNINKEVLIDCLKKICKTICCSGVYVSSAVSLAHSERAIVAELLNNKCGHKPLLGLILKHFVATHNNEHVVKVEVQIKTIKEICNSCKRLLNNSSYYIVLQGDRLKFIGERAYLAQGNNLNAETGRYKLCEKLQMILNEQNGRMFNLRRRNILINGRRSIRMRNPIMQKVHPYKSYGDAHEAGVESLQLGNVLKYGNLIFY